MSVVNGNSTSSSIILKLSYSKTPKHYIYNHISKASCACVFPKFHTHNRSIIITTLKASTEKQSNRSISVDDENNKNSELKLISGSQVVRQFYDGINRHDIPSVEPLIAENCVYEDLIFPSPFLGRKSILEFFGKFVDYVSTDLQFVIDAISEEDSLAVGVTWHLEWKGKPFPFSKGCSFYQLAIVNDTRQIIYARDSVEPAIKPGESALIAIRGVVWLLQQFPWLAERL